VCVCVGQLSAAASWQLLLGINTESATCPSTHTPAKPFNEPTSATPPTHLWLVRYMPMSLACCRMKRRYWRLPIQPGRRAGEAWDEGAGWWDEMQNNLDGHDAGGSLTLGLPAQVPAPRHSAGCSAGARPSTTYPRTHPTHLRAQRPARLEAQGSRPSDSTARQLCGRCHRCGQTWEEQLMRGKRWSLISSTSSRLLAQGAQMHRQACKPGHALVQGTSIPGGTAQHSIAAAL